ncbi:MAG: prepilin peptidase [Candidatus Nomurabacteria bacterium]|jgi:prepilin signal peptidase PulO-like enzyme (type II secretory pathway)|nr:prepilin peptidase [Candidatus Nomurabacteria bacterium]
MEKWILAVGAFIFGAAFGSFVGALVWRMKKGGKLWREFWRGGHSECEHCHHRLLWFELLPIISWICLRGKCRYCHKKIGATTFLLEIFLGVAFLISFLWWPFSWAVGGITLFILWLIALILMAALLVYDAKWQLLPNKLMFPLLIVGVAFAITSFVVDLTAGASAGQLIVGRILAFIPVAGIYGSIYILSKGKLVGFGDVKFGLFVGLVASWQESLIILFAANLLGTLYVMPSMLRKKVKMTSKIPFGPFLIIATFAVVLFGAQIVKWLQTDLMLFI